MSQKTAEKAPEIILPPISPFVGAGGRKTTTQSTTPAPTIPTEDPCRTTTPKGPITNQDLEILKDHIRQLNGKPVSMPVTRRRISSPCKTPLKPPRQNETSRIRSEMRKYRLIQRSAQFIKYHTGQHSELFSGDKPLTAEQERKLLNEAKHLTAEEILREKQNAEADYLKYLASKVRTSKDFRPNRASEFRFKHMRGEPIITSNYESNYDYHEKPPFFFARRYVPMPRWKLPPIDKEKETWFLPQDDGDVSLHLIPKEPEPKKKEKRKVLKKGKRTRPVVNLDPTSRADRKSKERFKH